MSKRSIYRPREEADPDPNELEEAPVVLQTRRVQSANLRTVVSKDGRKSLVYRESLAIAIPVAILASRLILVLVGAIQHRAFGTASIVGGFLLAFLWWLWPKTLLSFKDKVLTFGKVRVLLNGSEEICHKKSSPKGAVGLKAGDHILWFGEGGNHKVIEAKRQFLWEVLEPLQQGGKPTTEGLLPAPAWKVSPWSGSPADASEETYRTHHPVLLQKRARPSLRSLFTGLLCGGLALTGAIALIHNAGGNAFFHATVLGLLGLYAARPHFMEWRKSLRESRESPTIELPTGFVSASVHRMVLTDPNADSLYEVRAALSDGTEMAIAERLSAQEAHQIAAATQVASNNKSE